MIDLVLRLLASVVLGLVVGIERQITHRPAGLRTHALVSLGACLFTITSISYFSADPAVIVSTVVLGVGFIGAGCIIGSGKQVQGITTATSLWAAGAIGVAVGTGDYIMGLVVAVLVVLILQLRKVEEFLK